MTLELNTVHEGDCLTLMKDIPDKSVDMILCDLPYGTTFAKWDKHINFEKLWVEYKRIIKDNGAIVLTAQQPFTSLLVCSNPEMYNHSWTWHKDKSANFLLGKYQPLKTSEDILVFSKGAFHHNAKIKCTYNPQYTDRKPRKKMKESARSENMECINGQRLKPTNLKYSEDFKPNKNLPKNIIYFATDHLNRLHPTQKPLTLFEYLIRTYTNEGDTVLDNCVGSGTTAIAAINTNRNYIGIEQDAGYVAIARQRISDAIKTEVDGLGGE